MANASENQKVVAELAEKFETLEAHGAARGDALIHLARVVEGKMTVEQVQDILAEQHDIYRESRFLGGFDKQDVRYAAGYITAWNELKDYLR